MEIDHPGNVHLLVGGLLAGAGVLNAVGALAVWSEAPRDEFNEFLAYQLLGNALVYLAVGVPLGVWGWSTWDGSRSSASGVGHYSVPAQPRLLLVPNVDAKNSKLGLGLLLSF